MGIEPTTSVWETDVLPLNYIYRLSLQHSLIARTFWRIFTNDKNIHIKAYVVGGLPLGCKDGLL